MTWPIQVDPAIGATERPSPPVDGSPWMTTVRFLVSSPLPEMRSEEAMSEA